MAKETKKRGPGQPKMTAVQRREIQKYRANAGEMAKISKRAAKCKVPVSTYVRMRALGEL